MTPSARSGQKQGHLLCSWWWAGVWRTGKESPRKSTCPLPTAKSTDKKARQSTVLARVGTWFTRLMPTAEQERSRDSDGDHSPGSNQGERVMSFMKKKKKKHTERQSAHTKGIAWFVFWGDLFSSELYKYLGRFLFSFCGWETEDGVECKYPAKIAEWKSESCKVKPGFLIPRPLLAFQQLHTLKVKSRASLPTHEPLITYFKSALSRVPVPQPLIMVTSYNNT